MLHKNQQELHSEAKITKLFFKFSTKMWKFSAFLNRGNFYIQMTLIFWKKLKWKFFLQILEKMFFAQICRLNVKGLGSKEKNSLIRLDTEGLKKF